MAGRNAIGPGMFAQDEVKMSRDCRKCDKKEAFARDAAHHAAILTGKTIMGLGVGVCLGVGALAVAAVTEVAIPAILTFKALGLTGGAVGFLKGAKDIKATNKKAREE
jgi:hypothetical protein